MFGSLVTRTRYRAILKIAYNPNAIRADKSKANRVWVTGNPNAITIKKSDPNAIKTWDLKSNRVWVAFSRRNRVWVTGNPNAIRAKKYEANRVWVAGNPNAIWSQKPQTCLGPR